jgi:hypothetical protein
MGFSLRILNEECLMCIDAHMSLRALGDVSGLDMSFITVIYLRCCILRSARGVYGLELVDSQHACCISVSQIDILLVCWPQ